MIYKWPTDKENILKGAGISIEKKLEGVRLLNELTDKILTKRQKKLRLRLRSQRYPWPSCHYR